MDFLWLIIGFIIGLIVAWFYLGARHKKLSAEREAALLQGKREAEEALERERDAHNAAKQRASELETQYALAREETSAVSAELKTSEEKLAQVEAASGEVAELQEQARRRDGQIRQLESELADCRAKTADTASAPAAPAAAGTAPAFAASAPESGAPSPGAAGDNAGGAMPAYAATSPASETPGSGAADDLTRIKGIGQVLKGKLNQLGITTFRQIAEFTAADIERIDAVLDFPGRIEREKWVEQARDMVR